MRDEIELQNGEKQISELVRYLELPIYDRFKTEGDKLVTESVADFEKGSIDHVLFEGNMRKALICYDQAVASAPENAVG